MAYSIRSSQSISQANQGSTVTIASVVAGDIIVFVGCVGDSDHAHTGIDSAFTVGGVAMAAATPQKQSTNNQVDIWFLVATGGAIGTNVSFVPHYHAGSPGYLGAIYVISGLAGTGQPAANAGATSNSGTNPSISLASAVAGDLIIEAVSGSQSPSAGASQTVDFTATGNGQNFAIAHKTAAGGTNTESWTASSGDYCIAGINLTTVITAFIAAPAKVILQAINRASTF